MYLGNNKCAGVKKSERLEKVMDSPKAYSQRLLGPLLELKTLPIALSIMALLNGVERKGL